MSIVSPMPPSRHERPSRGLGLGPERADIGEGMLRGRRFVCWRRLKSQNGALMADTSTKNASGWPLSSAGAVIGCKGSSEWGSDAERHGEAARGARQRARAVRGHHERPIVSVRLRRCREADVHRAATPHNCQSERVATPRRRAQQPPRSMRRASARASNPRRRSCDPACIRPPCKCVGAA